MQNSLKFNGKKFPDFLTSLQQKAGPCILATVKETKGRKQPEGKKQELSSLTCGGREGALSKMEAT